MSDRGTLMPLASITLAEETPWAGLSSAEVAERQACGLGAKDGERSSRSVLEILRANVLTRFNFIMGTLLAVILAVGPRRMRSSGSSWSPTC
jgi:cation-transporting P-type ATPase E